MCLETCFLTQENDLMAILEEIAENVIKGQAPKVEELTKQAIADNLPVGDILTKGLIGGMSVIGVRFKANEVYVPEVLIAARAMKAGMVHLKPLLADSDVKPLGKVIIGTVKGDLHDIGKNLVAMMLEGAGFEVVDAGIDVPAEKFIELIKEHNPNVVGLSALLTTTMPGMETSIKAIKDSGIDVKTMIGGAPVTQKYADEINADGYAPDAASAVDTAKQLMGAA
jgi:5-methyltetrahydrofolate--homocysteine methyltransferase